MSFLKQTALRILGEERYLKLLGNSFPYFFSTGTLGKEYQDIYFLASFIKPGDCCIDIGAHLGYYTLRLSTLVGESGHIYAIEPMSKFYNVLHDIVERKKVKNITLYKLALGGEEEFVEMGIPRVNNMKKFAYARIMHRTPSLDYVETERIKNGNGDELFQSLNSVDFIKCDVEGFEVPVFRSMMEIMAKHKPVLLCELADNDDRIALFNMLAPLGYQSYALKSGKLHSLDVYGTEHPVSHNHYFIPLSRKSRFDSHFA